MVRTQFLCFPFVISIFAMGNQSDVIKCQGENTTIGAGVTLESPTGGNTHSFCQSVYFQEKTKQKQMIELKSGETISYKEITLTHKDGGHKILADENGKRSGDLSFADIVFKSGDAEPVKHRFFAPVPERINKPFRFGQYLFSVKTMSWNGVGVVLQIITEKQTKDIL